MTAPDVLYVVRPGDDNDELRYSLRSLVNMRHRDVVIVGHCPPWVTGVQRWPTDQAGLVKQLAALRNLRVGLQLPLSQHVIYMNDDFHVIEPVHRVTPLHRGPLVEFCFDQQLWHPDSEYTQAAGDTMGLLDAWGHSDALNYEAHVPITLDRELCLAVLDHAWATARELGKARLIRLLWRTLYGNVAGLAGQRIEDVKLYHPDNPVPPGPYVSSYDESWPGSKLQAHLAAMFPEPGPYEKA